MKYRIDGLRTVYTNQILYDRKQKILKFSSNGWLNYARQPHYRFGRVDDKVLRRLVLLTKRTYEYSMGVDTYFFLLARLGCPVTDLHTNKRLNLKGR